MSLKKVLFGLASVGILSYGVLIFVGDYYMPYGCWKLPLVSGCRFTVDPVAGRYLYSLRLPARAQDISLDAQGIDAEMKARLASILGRDDLLSRDVTPKKTKEEMRVGPHVSTNVEFLNSICGARGFVGLQIADYYEREAPLFGSLLSKRRLNIWCRSV